MAPFWTGLLVSAVAIQRPDLFGAALPRAGVHDMLRYQHFTLGPQWAGEYGLSDDPEQFRTLLAYSPLHNATRARYPAFLITAADHDDRVVPAHSYKLAAALQHAQSGPAPILIHVDRESGHSGVSGRSRKLDALADRYAFLVRALDIDTRSTSTARTTSGSR